MQRITSCMLSSNLGPRERRAAHDNRLPEVVIAVGARVHSGHARAGEAVAEHEFLVEELDANVEEAAEFERGEPVGEDGVQPLDALVLGHVVNVEPTVAPASRSARGGAQGGAHGDARGDCCGLPRGDASVGVAAGAAARGPSSASPSSSALGRGP
ncbi:unnamed protein product [Prorocentrum cordatum]|uniref:Uncharacterized protein n=1 Tax=Prorocentrum cordatum TaxID=2364126 RepID=A0ABN9Q1I5_9DINO|nr:unnamed protein product [Polarella glacialis]